MLNVIFIQDYDFRSNAKIISMEISILEKNLKQIARYNPELARRVRNHTVISKPFEFAESMTGDVILVYDGIPLHDTRDPQQEALDICASASGNVYYNIDVIFGLGLGYLFKRFLMDRQTKILIYEPNLDILRITLEVADFSEDLSRDNVVLINDTKNLDIAFNRLYFKDTEVFMYFLNSYRTMYLEEMQAFTELLTEKAGIYGSHYRNLCSKARLWTNAGIKNIPDLLANNDLEELRGAFKGKPAVIISAGPSLDKNIHLLKDRQDEFVIFCVGTALKTAVKHGIKPDFLVIAESFDSTAQLEGVETSDMYMILVPTAHNKFFHIQAKKKFIYYPVNDLFTQWYKKFIDHPLTDYLNKGTVSVNALISAYIMGCSSITLIGQDLTYIEGRCYSKDSAYSELKLRKNPETGRMEIYPENMEAYLSTVSKDLPREVAIDRVNTRLNKINSSLYYVKGQSGEMLPTEPGYAMFIRFFEEVAQILQGKVRLINASVGGAYLDGYEHIPFENVIKQYARQSINTCEIENKSLKSAQSKMLTLKRIYNELEENLKAINTVKDTGSKIAAEWNVRFDSTYCGSLGTVQERAVYLACGLKEIIENFRNLDEQYFKKYPFLYNYLVEQYLDVREISIRDEIPLFEPNTVDLRKTRLYMYMSKLYVFYNVIDMHLSNLQENTRKAIEKIKEGLVSNDVC